VFATVAGCRRRRRRGGANGGGDPNPELNIGVPLAGTEWWARRARPPVAPGEIGEIHQSGRSGAGLSEPAGADGRPLPAARRAGDGRTRRYYRSGDLALVRPDGRWSRRPGRRKVKINGYRIEIGEVEHALRGPRECWTSWSSPPRAGSASACWWPSTPLARSAGRRLTARLVAHGRIALPAFMMPRQFVHVPTIPLSPRARRNKRALAEQVR